MVETNPKKLMQIWPDYLTEETIITIECIAIEVKGDKSKVSKILQFVNKTYPLSEMVISPTDQATLRQKLHIENEEHIFYGKYKLPENPTNDIA